MPKKLGIDINRFMIVEELLCISSENVYGKEYHRICIPPDSVSEILEKAHITTGHGGIKRVSEHIKIFAWWRTLLKDIKNFCDNCKVCKKK